MKQILVMMAAVLVVGCSKETPETSQAAEAEPQVAPEPTPVSPADEKLIADPIVEKAVRLNASKFEGELTENDLAKVKTADFSATKITDASLKEVAKLQQLKKLWLSATKITDAGLEEVSKLQKLKFIGLDNTNITDAGLKEVAKLQSLTQLSLADTKVTDACLKELAKMQQLKMLGLNDTKITDAGVAELKKALPNCRIFGP